MFGNFYLLYQPIFCLRDLSRVVGYEALIRHPVGWSPGDLFREARLRGAIPFWELRILERAAGEALSHVPEMLFFNISPEAFLDLTFPVKAVHLLEKKGIAPARVCVEVSEQNLYKPEDFEKTLDFWIACGFFTALDDLGTKGANLDLVLKTKLDYVKVNRALISGIARNKHMQGLIVGIVEMLLGNGVFPILEGLEKEDDLKWLQEKGWDIGVQGFILACPAVLPEYSGIE
ncbi:MAG: EAL domain-containing protein [Bacillota bacterium]|nr:EAL domain-containing protein [Bacillota bacterium]